LLIASCSSPFQRILTDLDLLMVRLIEDSTSSPSFGAVTPGVISTALSCGTMNEVTV